MAEGKWVGGHEIRRLYRAQQHNVLVHALVTHDSDGSTGIKCSKGLANLVVESCLADHADEDVVRLAGHFHALGRDFSKDPDGDALGDSRLNVIQIMLGRRTYRSGEWVAHNKVLGDTQLTAKLANLILKELSQWLDKLKSLAFGHSFR